MDRRVTYEQYLYEPVRPSAPRRVAAAPRPVPGDVLAIGAAASVQFAGDRALVFRVTKVHDWVTYDGWVWLGGYVLDRRGRAVERRDIFVRTAGLRRIGG